MTLPPAPSTPLRLRGTFRYPLFSSKGALEGGMIDTDDGLAQVVFDPGDAEAAPLFASIAAGTAVSLEVTPDEHAGKSRHAVFRLHADTGPEGHPTVFKGIVVRLHYARHGEPNGVVLDTGDFLHLKSSGMADHHLAVGDTVTAAGPSRPLATGDGKVVEVVAIDGAPVRGKPTPE